MRLFWFEDPIPREYAEKYYLYYYTLPKIKFFNQFSHETYYGGKSKVHIEKWLLKKIQKVVNSSLDLQNWSEVQSVLSLNDKVIIYVGKET